MPSLAPPSCWRRAVATSEVLSAGVSVSSARLASDGLLYVAPRNFEAGRPIRAVQRSAAEVRWAALDGHQPPLAAGSFRAWPVPAILAAAASGGLDAGAGPKSLSPVPEVWFYQSQPTVGVPLATIYRAGRQLAAASAVQPGAPVPREGRLSARAGQQTRCSESPTADGGMTRAQPCDASSGQAWRQCVEQTVR